MGRYVRGGNCHAATRHYDCHCLLRSTCMSVHGLQDLSYYGFVFGYSRSPTEAQLRLAPNRPCMTLVYNKWSAYCLTDAIMIRCLIILITSYVPLLRMRRRLRDLILVRRASPSSLRACKKRGGASLPDLPPRSYIYAYMTAGHTHVQAGGLSRVTNTSC